MLCLFGEGGQAWNKPNANQDVILFTGFVTQLCPMLVSSPGVKEGLCDRLRLVNSLGHDQPLNGKELTILGNFKNEVSKARLIITEGNLQSSHNPMVIPCWPDKSFQL